MKLTTKLRENSGNGWVRDCLSLITHLGRALAKSPKWYGPAEKYALEEELDRVAQACAMYEAQSKEMGALSQGLKAFRDIGGSLERPGGAPMDEVELFEVKHFLITLERLEGACAPLQPFAGIAFYKARPLLEILDPAGRRLPNFSPAEYDPAILTSERDEADERALTVRRKLTEAILERQEELRADMDAIGRMDLTLAKARLARSYHCVKPEIAGQADLTGEDMVHPAVAASLAERERDFTPISIRLARGATVITGANMGGKSVALKTITLNILLMQTGFFVFAGAFSAPLFDEAALVWTDDRSLEQGLVSFGAEAQAVGEVLERGRGRFFFLAVDEFARGASPKEGGALARALTEYLQCLNCVAVLTTHYDGVADAAGAHYRVAGLSDVGEETCFTGEDLLGSLSEMMDYHLLPAAPDAPCPRDALQVCRLLKLDEELIQIFLRDQ